MILHCKTCGERQLVEGLLEDGVRAAWVRRKLLTDFCKSCLPSQDIEAFLGKELAFFVLHTDHEVVAIDEAGAEHPIDVANLLSLSIQPTGADVPAIVEMLENLCARSIRSEIQGIVLAAQSGLGTYELKWAGWNDPFMLAGAMEAAKFTLFSRVHGQREQPEPSTSEPSRSPDNVAVLRPERQSANAVAVAKLLFELRDRAAAGHILGIVVALQTGAKDYEVKWEGWTDPVLAAGAIDAAKHGFLSNGVGLKRMP